jgi:hypothetical protein
MNKEGAYGGDFVKRGKSCGKTTTIGLAYDLVMANGGTSTMKKPLGGNKKDFEDVVRYNGMKVAFFPMGDYSGVLIDAMKNADANGIDKFVCACNSRFVRPFQHITQYKHTIVNKQIAKTKTMELPLNTQDATTIFFLI